MKLSDSAVQDAAFKALDAFKIEIPSWGFANTGTRFGKFVQAAAATTIEEKFADAGEVNRLTGVTPTIDPMTGQARSVWTGPAGRYWTDGVGDVVNSNTQPSGSWHEIQPLQ